VGALDRELRAIPVRKRVRVVAKVDFKRELGEFYAARRSPEVVEVPELAFLMIDGHGNPNTSGEYRHACRRCSPSPTRPGSRSKRACVIDFGVMPLEGLWWAADMSGVLERGQVGVGLDDADHAAG
jgi:hypothetical protein